MRIDAKYPFLSNAEFGILSYLCDLGGQHVSSQALAAAMGIEKASPLSRPLASLTSLELIREVGQTTDDPANADKPSPFRTRYYSIEEDGRTLLAELVRLSQLPEPFRHFNLWLAHVELLQALLPDKDGQLSVSDAPTLGATSGKYQQARRQLLANRWLTKTGRQEVAIKAELLPALRIMLPRLKEVLRFGPGTSGRGDYRRVR